ncbi:hypothetical protein N431DRAFT_477797 [Stipitochalara longipes BDJ]|nr:hypothetical protein N431DRAFT_477797 [Stipitochalara longipes BDJ]
METCAQTSAFLAEEVSMSRQVAQQLKDLGHALEEENSSRVQGFTEAIVTQLNRARPVWGELEEILKSVRGPAPSRIRKGRWLRKANRVISLQGKLREIRHSTLEILGIYNASQGVQNGSAVAKYHHNLATMYETTATSLSEILVKLKEIESSTMKQKVEFTSDGCDWPATGLRSQSNPHEGLQCNSTVNHHVSADAIRTREEIES